MTGRPLKRERSAILRQTGCCDFLPDSLAPMPLTSLNKAVGKAARHRNKSEDLPLHDPQGFPGYRARCRTNGIRLSESATSFYNVVRSLLNSPAAIIPPPLLSARSLTYVPTSVHHPGFVSVSKDSPEGCPFFVSGRQACLRLSATELF